MSRAAIKLTKPSGAKPTLTDFPPCCGQCYFCHPRPDDGKRTGCFVDPPQYLYGEKDDAEYDECRPIETTRPACDRFRNKTES